MLGFRARQCNISFKILVTVIVFMRKLILIFLFYMPAFLHAHSASLPLCAVCHGQDGQSANPQWPNLAGQNTKYFIKQLQDMRDPQKRNAPTMNALVKTLNDQDMEELAAYYAKMPSAKSSKSNTALTRGKQLYRSGDFKKHIAACIACHGPEGRGNNQAGFPSLTGQHAAYTVLQLQAFKDGLRQNDLNHIMKDISTKMSLDDMDAVAQYIEHLPEE